MADDVCLDPDAVGRCPPYPRQPIGTAASSSRFPDSPHLTLLLLSPEHVGTILTGERIVNAPPPLSPLTDWLTSGDPETFRGTLLISWVFYRHMSLRDDSGLFGYKPQFFVRVVSDGLAPFTMIMDQEWYERANATMALPACGRSVHQVPRNMVRPLLATRAQRDVPVFQDWEFEILTQEVVIHRHCLRSSKPLMGTTVYDDADSKPAPPRQDFGVPPPADLGWR